MYSKLVDKIKTHLKEDVGGMVGPATTSGNPSVSYLPGGFTSAKNYLNSLAPLKKQWHLETVDEKDNYRLKFENALDIIVPKTAYDEFNEKVLKVKGKKKVDLYEALNEDVKQQIEAGFRRVNQLLLNGVKKKPSILQSIVLMEIFIRLFPKYQFLPKESNVLFGLNTYNRDVADAINYVRKLYGEELGKLESLIHTLETNQPLNSVAPFSKFEYLVGVLIKTNYQGVELVLDLGVNMSLRAIQTIHVSNSPETLEEIQAIKSIKVIRDSIVPIGPCFTPKDLTLIKKITDDAVNTKPGK